MAVVVMAIIVVISWPDSEAAAKEAARLAALKFESDVDYARSYSISRPDDPACIKIKGVENRYWLATNSSPDTPMAHPQSGDPYVVQFGTGGLRGMENVTIHAVDAGADQVIRFDGTGAVDSDSVPVLQLSTDGAPYEVKVSTSGGSCMLSETYTVVLEPVVDKTVEVVDETDKTVGEIGDVLLK